MCIRDRQFAAEIGVFLTKCERARPRAPVLINHFAVARLLSVDSTGAGAGGYPLPGATKNNRTTHAGVDQRPVGAKSASGWPAAPRHRKERGKP